MFKTKFNTVRASSMEVGEVYSIALHDNRDQKIAVELVSRPSCAIRDMNENDAYVLRRLDGRGEYVLRRNKTAPHFLVTESKGVRGPTQVRVTMFERVRVRTPSQARTTAAVAA